MVPQKVKIKQSLSDTVIAAEDDICSLYDPSKNQRRRIFHLYEAGLLPLTVKTFTASAGKAFLHFAAWVDMSGHINEDFIPVLYGRLELLASLAEKYFSPLGRFRTETASNPKYGGIYLTENAGVYGRLIHAAGVQMAGTSRPGYSRKTKVCLARELPAFFNYIHKAKPGDDEEILQKNTLLRDIAMIIFADRYTSFWNAYSDFRGLSLKCHHSISLAKRYGKQIIGFLNPILFGSQTKYFFSPSQIKIVNQGNALWECALQFNYRQFAFLSSSGSPILTPASPIYLQDIVK